MEIRNIKNLKQAEKTAQIIHEELKDKRVMVNGIYQDILNVKAVPQSDNQWEIILETPFDHAKKVTNDHLMTAVIYPPVRLWKVEGYAENESDVQYWLT